MKTFKEILEMSRQTLGKYASKATDQLPDLVANATMARALRAMTHNSSLNIERDDKDERKMKKRMNGLKLAVKKITAARPVHEESISGKAAGDVHQWKNKNGEMVSGKIVSIQKNTVGGLVHNMQLADGKIETLNFNEEVQVEDIQEGVSKRHPLEGHAYHSKSNSSLKYIMKDAGEAMRAMKGRPEAEGKYADQMNDAATVLHFREKSGTPDWYKEKYKPASDLSEDILQKVKSLITESTDLDREHNSDITEYKNGVISARKKMHQYDTRPAYAVFKKSGEKHSDHHDINSAFSALKSL